MITHTLTHAGTRKNRAPERDGHTAEKDTRQGGCASGLLSGRLGRARPGSIEAGPGKAELGQSAVVGVGESDAGWRAE